MLPVYKPPNLSMHTPLHPDHITGLAQYQGMSSHITGQNIAGHD